MPTKRRTSGLATKAQQSTLAFHGSTNRVTKPTRVSNGKKPVIPEGVAKCTKPDVVDIDALEESKLTTVEADVIFQVEKDIAAESTPEEEEAKQITETAIKKYWATKERQRLAPRVHQQDLSVHQKILREFDVSGQYGPCTGIARVKRWKRAHRFELDPPIEVLAVLLKEQEQDQDGTDKLAVQRSHVDDLLNIRTEVAT